MKLPSTWPQYVKSGNTQVPIYHRERQIKGRQYHEFVVAYYTPEGSRKQEAFGDFEKAKKKAESVTGSLAKGDIKTLTLSGNEVLEYERAKQVLAPLDVHLDVAIADYAEAKKKLGTRSLSDAVHWFMRNCSTLKPATVQEVYDDFIKRLEKPPVGQPASVKYVKDMECRLGSFAEAFQCPIGSLTKEMVGEFLREMTGGARNKYNTACAIRTFLNFARRNDRFPKDLDILDPDWFEFEDMSEIEVFRPEEMARLLTSARPEMVPVLAIGAFAGLRTAEIERLDWSNVRADHIEVTKGNAKTRSRRLVPIQENLAKWLSSYRKESGPVVGFVNLSREFLKVAAATAQKAKGDEPSIAPVAWKHNALRHSFVSYRMATLKNEHQVAQEAGNSPQMIYQNYRELVTETEGKAWFSVQPDSANLTGIPKVAASETILRSK
jgi:integrase